MEVSVSVEESQLSQQHYDSLAGTLQPYMQEAIRECLPKNRFSLQRAM